MSINKNTIWTVFFFLLALVSPVGFNLFPVSGKGIANLTAMMYVLSAVIIFVVHLKTEDKNEFSQVKTSVSKLIMFGLMGIFASMFLQTALAMIEVVVFNQSLGSANTQDITAIVKKAPLFVVAVAVAGPIMEEFVFRFSLIHFLNQKLNIWLSAIISSFCFAVLHGDGHYLIYGGLGFFFFLLYKKTGSIYTSIITHAGMNTVVILAQLFVSQS